MATRQTAEMIADALQKHDFDDWYYALLMSAVDEHGGDLAAAIATADEAYKQPKPAIAPATDDALEVFG